MLDKETVEDIAFEAMQKGALAVIHTVQEGINRGVSTDDLLELMNIMEDWHKSGECREETLGDRDERRTH